MQLFLIISGDFVKTGGMDRANYALADYLIRQNYEVHLVAYRIAPEFQRYPNIFFHKVPKILNSYFLSGFLLDWIGTYWASKISKRGGRVIVNGGNCRWGDINWVHYVHAAYQPIIESDFLRKFIRCFTYKFDLRNEQKAFQKARLIITNSERTKQYVVEKLGVCADSVHAVYYGVNSKMFRPATDEERIQLRCKFGWPTQKKVIVFVGALTGRRKGFDVLFSAWKKLCAKPDWDGILVVVGAGRERPFWQRCAEETGLSNSIQFLGFRSDVPDILRAADCLLSPTRYEAYGLGVHEALCCGIPAIISASAGIAERYPQDLGSLSLLPNPENIDDLVNHLLLWKENKQKYFILTKSFSEKLREVNWDKMAQHMLNLIASQPVKNSKES